MGQLRDAIQQNFQSAYSPYQRDNLWQRKFDHWWRVFLSHNSELKLETTYERKSDGTTVRGYAFNGFSLTIPRSDPPPKGTPTVFQWAILIKPDGTVRPTLQDSLLGPLIFSPNNCHKIAISLTTRF